MNKVILVALMFLSGPAMAGTVYRCVGADGIPNYTSKRASNAVCKAVAHSQDRVSGFSTKPSPVPPPAAAPAVVGAASTPAPATPAGKVVFQSTAGGTAPPVAP